jgi:hypothetical protein
MLQQQAHSQLKVLCPALQQWLQRSGQQCLISLWLSLLQQLGVSGSLLQPQADCRQRQMKEQQLAVHTGAQRN